MKDYSARLNLSFQARDEEEAREIAALCKQAIELYEKQPFKVSVDVDFIQED